MHQRLRNTSEKKKGSKEQIVKPLTPTRATDALVGMKNQKENKRKKQGALIIWWAYSDVPLSTHRGNILLLRGNPSRQHFQVVYHWGSGEEERQENMEKYE